MFVSIVIPTYNRALYIHKTILSLLGQHYDHFEIIVVDDGSTDNTEEVVAFIKDPRLKYFKKNNAERAAARNYGARLAKGEYINFFDSDDIAYPNHLGEAIDAINKLESPEVFHLGYDVKDPDGNLMRVEGKWSATINNRLIDGNYLSCNGVFIRKDVAAQFPFNENRLLSASEDYELWLRLASRYPIHCLSVITSTVVNHDGRSVLNIQKDRFIARFNVLQEALMNDDEFLRTYRHQLKLFQSYINIYMALHLAMARYSKKMCLNYLGSALKLKPSVFFTRRFLAALKNILI
jgi:glycosyltransferase involved in cell wall biosynthesis